MAQASQDRSANALLQEAIDSVRDVAFRTMWLLIGLGLFSSVLSTGILFNSMNIFMDVPFTLSHDSLVSSATLWVILLVATTILHMFQQAGFAHLSRFCARRMCVPAVLAIAQRAGRPEAITSAALNDLETVRSAMADATGRALVGVLVVPPMIIFTAVLHWSILLLTVAFCAVAALLSLSVARAATREAELTTGGVAQSYGLAADAMRSGEAVLAMGMLPRLIGNWMAISTKAAGEAWQVRSAAARWHFLLGWTLAMFRGAILFMISFLTLSGVSLGGMVAMVTILATGIVGPFVTLGETTRGFGEALAAWRRLCKIVADTPPPPDGIAFPCPEGRLVVEHMSFTFRGPQPVLLRNIDLAVEPGSIVAILGPSGSGKSTLMRLLIGLYRPSAGGVYLDGHATAQWDRRDLARHVGFLPQQPLLARGTAAEVIARLEEPNMELVLEAARRSGAHEVIASLPLGYATPISGNYQLSMGQRHRIAIARALYGRPKLLILDELASSLDPEGEAQMADLLAQLRREGVSVIFTTHRPALIAAADRVLTIRNGTLVPTGEDALRLGGGRAKLSHAQRQQQKAAA